MVLSNKKLKERLRAVKAAALANGDSALGSEVSVDQTIDFHSKELQSLLDARMKQHSKSSKRVKKRKSLSVTGINDHSVEKKKNEKNATYTEFEEQPAAKRVNRPKNKSKERKIPNIAKGDDTIVAKEESQMEEKGNTKVYAGGIPYYSTEDDIRSYFEGCGTITEIHCLTFPDSGKFRGIAIISFKTEAAAKRAIDLDGSDMGGFYLKLKPYKPLGSNNGSNFQAEIVEGYNRIYVGNLSWDITEEDVRRCFSECKITSVRFGVDKETGVFKGYAHVELSDNLSVLKAMKLNKKVVCGRPIKVSCAIPKKGKKILPLEGSKGGEAAESESPVDTTSDVVGVTEGPFNTTSNEVGFSEAPVSGKIRRRTCLECGQKGHLYANCPNKLTPESS